MTGRRGRLFVVSGPSGVGKGTVIRGVIAERPGIRLSTSATTRDPRPGEEDGVQYHFVTDQRFDELIEAGAFLEWADVFGERYGTLAEQVDALRRAGTDVILEIDVQGARAVHDRVADAVLIFLAPPSVEELRRRLVSRGTETAEEVERRLALAEREMAQGEEPWFDHFVVNDEISRAVAEVLAIIEAPEKE